MKSEQEIGNGIKLIIDHTNDEKIKKWGIWYGKRRNELLQDLKHFKETEKTRELNSFEKGIKEEVERLLKTN